MAYSKLVEHLKRVHKDRGVRALLEEIEVSYTDSFLSLQEVAYIMQVTSERIRQIEEVALEKLKKPINHKKLKAYIDI